MNNNDNLDQSLLLKTFINELRDEMTSFKENSLSKEQLKETIESDQENLRNYLNQALIGALGDLEKRVAFLSEELRSLDKKSSLSGIGSEIDRLSEVSAVAASSVQQAGERYKGHLKKTWFYFVGASLFGGLVGGLLGGMVMRNFPKLDDYVQMRYEWGRSLDMNWKDFTPQEQDKIKKIITGVRGK